MNTDPEPRAESDRVEVDRSDLAWALKYMTIDGAHTARVHQRLTEALQQSDGDQRG